MGGRGERCVCLLACLLGPPPHTLCHPPTHPRARIVSIECRDRTKLLFDTVCTLADLNYDIFHATIGERGLPAVAACVRACVGVALCVRELC